MINNIKYGRIHSWPCFKKTNLGVVFKTVQNLAIFIVHVWCAILFFSTDNFNKIKNVIFLWIITWIPARQSIPSPVTADGVERKVWAGEGRWGKKQKDSRKHFMIYATFLWKIFFTYGIVLLLLSLGGPEAWATHHLAKIILQPVWVSLWCLFHNNCLWIFIKIQVGCDLQPTVGPV